MDGNSKTDEVNKFLQSNSKFSLTHLIETKLYDSRNMNDSKMMNKSVNNMSFTTVNQSMNQSLNMNLDETAQSSNPVDVKSLLNFNITTLINEKDPEPDTETV